MQILQMKVTRNFEARVRGFRSAVLSNDRIGIAKYIDFPLRVSFSAKQSKMIKNQHQLAFEWDTVFSKDWIKAAEDAIPHDLFVKDGEAMLGNGLVWFGPKGAKELNTWALTAPTPMSP